MFAALDLHDTLALASYYAESMSPKKEELMPSSFINKDLIQQFEDYRDELVGKWNELNTKTQAITAKIEMMKVSSFFDHDVLY